MKKPPHDRGHPCQAACWKRGAFWLHGRRDELLAELRQKPSAQDMPTVEELMRRSVAPTLSEKPWCTCCFNVAQDIVKLLEADPTCLDTLPGAIRTSVRVSELKETETGTSPPTLKVGVKTELERAGRMDRVTLIRAQERGLDAVSFPALY